MTRNNDLLEQLNTQMRRLAVKGLSFLGNDPYFRPMKQYRKDDVFIVGFPKSGNTWMQSIVSCLKYGINPDFLPESLAQDLVPDVHSKRYYKRYGRNMAFKSHALPRKKYKRVIYLIRDGRDAIASYYGMYRNMGVQVDLEEMIIKGKHLFPSKWHEHVNAWKLNPYNAEKILVRYEDLIASPLPELRKVTQFLKLDHNDSFLESVAEGTQFKKMKERAKTLGTAHTYFDKRAEGHTFFRKGKVGSFKNDIPTDLIRFFEEEARSELERYGYLCSP
jgi:hypothetical protein